MPVTRVRVVFAAVEREVLSIGGPGRMACPVASEVRDRVGSFCLHRTDPDVIAAHESDCVAAAGIRRERGSGHHATEHRDTCYQDARPASCTQARPLDRFVPSRVTVSFPVSKNAGLKVKGTPAYGRRIASPSAFSKRFRHYLATGDANCGGGAMRGRLIYRAGLVVMALLSSMLVPVTNSFATSSPTIAIKDVRVVAQGAALAVDLIGSCDANELVIQVQVTQKTARGVQHGSGFTVSPLCDGTSHPVTVLVYPPPALVPPETVHAVYETAWTTQPVLLNVAAGFADVTVTQNQVVPVHAATPTNSAIAPRAAFKVNGSGIVVTLHLSCPTPDPPDPAAAYTLIVTAAQVGAKHHVQQASAFMAATCDSTSHTYRVPFAATGQPWNPAPALVEGDVCNQGSGACPPYIRTVFRTVTVQP